jgi:hypothetical protein
MGDEFIEIIECVLGRTKEMLGLCRLQPRRCEMNIQREDGTTGL